MVHPTSVFVRLMIDKARQVDRKGHPYYTRLISYGASDIGLCSFDD